MHARESSESSPAFQKEVLTKAGSVPGRKEEDSATFGIIAQLGEHLPYKQRVIGSSPIGPTIGDGSF